MESSNRAEMVLEKIIDGNCPLCKRRGITFKLTQTSLGDICEQGECGYVDGWDFGPRQKKEPPVDIRAVALELRTQYTNLEDVLASEGFCISRECMCDTSAPLVKMNAAITKLEQQSETIPAQETAKSGASS